MRNNRRRFKKKKWEKQVSIGKVACQLFNEKGFLETSLEDIAAAAKISKGALYYYFPSKIEILYFVLDIHGDRILGDLEQKLEQIEDGFSKIRFIISRHIDLYIQNVDESKAFINEKKWLPQKYYKIIKEKEKKYFQIAARVLSDLLGGRIKKGELTALTFTLFGMCTWTYGWYDPKGSVNPKELSEIIYGTFTRGVSRYLSKVEEE